MSSIWQKSRMQLRSSAVFGALVWLIIQFFLPYHSPEVTLIGRIVLFAILVLTPLGLSLAADSRTFQVEPLSYKAARIIQPFAGLTAAISFLLPAGQKAAMLASAWLLFTGLAALFGLTLLFRKANSFERACLIAGSIYISIGGAWLVASRLGYRPLGFGDTIVLLTAMHFHYAGFAAPIIAMAVGRRIRLVRPASMRLFNIIAIGVIAGTPLLAAGITFSPALEVAAATILSLSLIGLSILIIGIVVPGIASAFARTLLLIASVSVFASMLFAAGYSIGSVSGHPIITIPQMVESHGVANAFGFTLCGLLAFAFTQPNTEEEDQIRGGL